MLIYAIQKAYSSIRAIISLADSEPWGDEGDFYCTIVVVLYSRQNGFHRLIMSPHIHTLYHQKVSMGFSLKILLCMVIMKFELEARPGIWRLYSALSSESLHTNTFNIFTAIANYSSRDH